MSMAAPASAIVANPAPISLAAINILITIFIHRLQPFNRNFHYDYLVMTYTPLGSIDRRFVQF